MTDIAPAAIKVELDRIAKEIKAAAAETSGVVNSRLTALEQAIVNIEPGGHYGPGLGGESVSARVIAEIEQGNNPQFQTIRNGTPGSARFELNCSLRAAILQEGSDPYPTESQRSGSIVTEPAGVPTFMRASRHENAISDTFEAVILRAVGEAAEQVEEGTAKQQVELEAILRRFVIGTFAGHETASNQVLADNERLANAVSRVLGGTVLRATERTLILGGYDSSNTSKVEGLLEQAVAFPTPAADNAIDLIGAVAVKMRELGYAPDIALMSWSLWYQLSTLKATSDGHYLLGSPVNPLTAAWSLLMVPTEHLDDDVVIVADRSKYAVLDRQAISVQMSREHGDNFVKNLTTILLETRAGLVVYDQGGVRSVELGS